jgi:carbon monoxide dehydrogenase subunit G
VTIARPVDEVFQFLLDLDKNLLSTDPDVESVVKTPDGTTGPGTEVRIRHKFLWRTAESVTRFTAVEQDQKIEWDGSIGPMRPHAAFELEPADQATRLTFTADPNPVGPLKLLSPLVARMGRRVWGKRLQRIKIAIESGSPTTRNSRGDRTLPRADADTEPRT